MRKRTRPFTLALALAALYVAPPVAAQDEPHVFRGATVLPIAGPPIESGVLVGPGAARSQTSAAPTPARPVAPSSTTSPARC